jgi:hypothetical protein
VELRSGDIRYLGVHCLDEKYPWADMDRVVSAAGHADSISSKGIKEGLYPFDLLTDDASCRRHMLGY